MILGGTYMSPTTHEAQSVQILNWFSYFTREDLTKARVWDVLPDRGPHESH